VKNSGDQHRESQGRKSRRRRKRRKKQEGNGRRRIGEGSKRKEK